MQLTFFYFLPNILLSGFMFPFRACRAGRRRSATLLPLTYFNRLVRGILLKGNGWTDLWPTVADDRVHDCRDDNRRASVPSDAGLKTGRSLERC